jgi:drug/metabolite transporter (DMT)-like permease
MNCIRKLPADPAERILLIVNWKTKLTSRKFWVALAGLAVGVIALLSPGTDTSQIAGVIMALGSVVAYIVGEGLVDAANAGNTENRQ